MPDTGDDKTEMNEAPAASGSADQRPEDVAALEAEVARLRAENEALLQHDTAVLGQSGTPNQRWRWAGAVVLLVVAALLTPPALVGFWGQRTIVDAERYLSTVEPLAQSTVIQEAVAAQVTEAIVSGVDLDAFIQDNLIAELPPRAQVVGPAITGAVTSFVQTTVERFMASEAFNQLWIQVNTQVQKDLVKALRGDESGAVTIRDGVVYLDLGVVIDAVKNALIERGLTIFERLPASITTGREIVLLSSSQLNTAQTIWTFTEPIARWMLPVVFLLYLGAIALAPKRRRMLMVVGLVVVAAMVVLAAALTAGRAVYVNATADTSFSAALQVFFDTMIRYLWGSTGALAVLGGVLAVLAWLGGPSAPAGAVRRGEARMTSALGETAGRWDPMAALGRAVTRSRTALRAIVLATIIVVFILQGTATWQNVLWAVVIGAVLWIVVDVLAAAAVHASDASEGPGEAPPPGLDEPLAAVG